MRQTVDFDLGGLLPSFVRREENSPDMVDITFYDRSDRKCERQGKVGDSVMDVAVTTGIDGIEAICGGSCVCGTCHVHVDEKWLAKIAPASESEQDLIAASENCRPNSRLGCQIRLSEVLDGIVVRIPPTQP